MCSANPVNNHQLPELLSTTGADYLRSYITKPCFISIGSSYGYSLHPFNIEFINICIRCVMTMGFHTLNAMAVLNVSMYAVSF